MPVAPRDFTRNVRDIVADVVADVNAFLGVEATPVVFTQQPTVTPLTGTAGVVTFTATPGVLSDGSDPTRAYLFNGTALATTLSFSPDASISGSVTYQEYGPDGAVSDPIALTVIAAGGTPTPVASVPKPQSFPAMPAFTPIFERQGASAPYTFNDSFSWASTRASLSPTSTIWVDNETGNGSNPGTEASPLKSVTAALDLALAALPALTCVKVKGNATGAPRRYLNSAGDAPSKTYANMNIIIEPWADGELFDLLIDAVNPTWTATSDPNIWYATGGHEYVIDYTNMDGRRTARRVARHSAAAPSGETAAIAAVNALYTATTGVTDPTGNNYSLGALAYDTGANRTYLRLWDNRNPNGASNIVSTRTSLIGLQFDYTTSGRSFYITGLGHAGGTNGLQLDMDNIRPSGIFDRCRFIAGLGRGALTVIGDSNTVDGGDFLLHECVAHGAQSDGLNWQAVMRVVELDCWATWNGWNTATSNNGSTLHWRCNIIRKGGFYIWNQDRSIHDVGDINSWNMGVTSGTRRGVDGTGLSIAFACGHQTEVGVSKMWLDDCRVFGNPEFRTAIFTSDTMYYANLDFIPTAGPGTGVAVPYNADTGV